MADHLGYYLIFLTTVKGKKLPFMCDKKADHLGGIECTHLDEMLNSESEFLNAVKMKFFLSFCINGGFCVLLNAECTCPSGTIIL